jgi:hypothetical protein
MDPTDDEDVPELSELSRALSDFRGGMADLWRKLKVIEGAAPQQGAVRNPSTDDSGG